MTRALDRLQPWRDPPRIGGSRVGSIIAAGPEPALGRFQLAQLVSTLVVEGIVRVAQVESMRQPAQGFGVTQEQKATRSERSRQPRDDADRLFGLEVHQDVPAEHDVEAARRE